jgi:hypothetical protein
VPRAWRPGHPQQRAACLCSRASPCRGRWLPERGRLLPRLGALPELCAYLPGVAGGPRASPPPSAGVTVGGAALVARAKGPPCVQDAWARGSGAPARAPPLLEHYGRLAPCSVSSLVRFPHCQAAGGTWAELELSTRAQPCRAGAVRRARRARVGAVRRGRHDAELERFEVAPHRAELELSDARTTGPSWSCPSHAPRCRAGAVGRAHLGAELELSDVCATGSSCQNLLADSRGEPARP